MKLMRVTAVDHEIEDDDVLVQLTGRDEDGKRRAIKVEDTIPYFYAREESAWQVEDEDDVRSIEPGYESFDGIPLSRVNVRVPENIGGRRDAEDMTEEFRNTWESDIPYYRRVSNDYNLSGYIRVPDTTRCSINDIETEVELGASEVIDPRVLIGDIEVIVEDGVSFEEMQEKYNCPITHFSMWDSQADEYIVLHLDPEGKVDTSEVSAFLQSHIASEGAQSLSVEIERDIIIRSYETEEKLAEGFLSVIEKRRPDLTSGWNYIDFDWDYILGRFEKLDVSEHNLSDIGWISGYQTERRVDCLPAFDMMNAYCGKMTRGQWRSKSLDYVAKEELGAGKLPNISIADAYESRPNELLAYNIIDTMLCVALDRREGVHDFFYELAELSQIQIYDTFSEMRLVDGYIMSEVGDQNILPTAEEEDIPENAGGLVLNPSDGVREWVGVLDLKSLYPSVMITWNISPETIHWYDEETPEEWWSDEVEEDVEKYLNIPWLPDADHADGGQFTHDDIRFDEMWTDLSEEGLIPRVIKRLFPERAKRKEKRNQFDPDDEMYSVWDRKQAAVKVIMNSFYGVMSNDYWRLGAYGLGDAVTSAARYALWEGKEIGVEEGYEIYYGDTDSIMLSLAEPGEGKDAALERGMELEDTVNSKMERCISNSGMPDGVEHPFLTDELHGTDRHALVYEFEKLYRRFFQAGSKKRYAGRFVWKEGKDIDGDIDMVGFESNRSDSPELTSEIQPEVVNRILSGQGFSEISEYVRDLIDQIESREMDLYKVAIPASLGKDLDSYGNTQTARACRYSNKHLGTDWSKTDDPWVYYVSSTPAMHPGTEVIALDWDQDIPEGYELNMNKILDRACKGPLKPILREVDWRWTEVKQGAKTQSAAGDWSGEWNDDDDDEEEEEVDEWGW